MYITSCGGRQPLGIVVRDSWFEGDDVGIYYGGDARRLRIEGNYFTLNTTAAIHLDGGNEAIIANNIMRNNLLVSGNSNKVLVTGNEYYWHGIVFTNTLNTHLDIIGNKFYLAKDTHGIDANSNYLKILDNVFEGNKGNNFPNVGTGIKKLGYNGTVSGNIFHNLDEGILSTGARTIIQNNVFSDCTIAIGSFGPDSSILYNSFNDCSNTISNPGQGHVLLSNSGYLTENSGIATLPAKSSHVVVDHGCAIPPMVVNITLAERLANKISYWWVDSIDDTTFTFHVDTAPGENNLDFYWTATVK